MTEPSGAGPYGALWDWRRQVARLYAAVRDAASSEAGWVIWREGRDALFRNHAQSPLDPPARAGFQSLPCYPYDPALRFAVGLRAVEGRRFTAPAGDDGEIALSAFAITEGLAPVIGRELTLFWIGGYGGGVFLPFGDATNGRETYGAGRYLLDTIKSADLGVDRAGQTVLDFNFAYNPSCSYSPRYVCPLAPAENRVERAICAGELSAANGFSRG